MSTGEFLLYTTEDGVAKLEVRMVDETVWLSLTQMVELFQRDKSVISRHIKNIYEEGELAPQTTVANFATVQREGARAIERNVTHYHFDVIISVGYRFSWHLTSNIPTRVTASRAIPYADRALRAAKRRSVVAAAWSGVMEGFTCNEKYLSPTRKP